MLRISCNSVAIQNIHIELPNLCMHYCLGNAFTLISSHFELRLCFVWNAGCFFTIEYSNMRDFMLYANVKCES